MLSEARAILARGGSPLIYTASGPASDRGEALNALPDGRVALSRELGRLAKTLVQEFALKRLVIAGGDTSSHALSELNIHALTTRFPLLDTPGSPLCTAHSASAEFDGLELAMKGGQVGKDDYFVRLKDGRVLTPAGNIEDRAGDVGGGRRQQPDRRFGDLLGRSRPLHRQVRRVVTARMSLRERLHGSAFRSRRAGCN